MLFLGDVVDAIVGRESHAELGDDLACIADGGNPMNRHARLRLSSRLDSLVDVMSPHTLTAVFRQEGRVDIDDLMGIGVDEKIRHERQEAGQHDEADVVFL